MPSKPVEDVAPPARDPNAPRPEGESEEDDIALLEKQTQVTLLSMCCMLL